MYRHHLGGYKVNYGEGEGLAQVSGKSPEVGVVNRVNSKLAQRES